MTSLTITIEGTVEGQPFKQVVTGIDRLDTSFVRGTRSIYGRGHKLIGQYYTDRTNVSINCSYPHKKE